MVVSQPIVAVTGLHVEARIASGTGVTTVSGGGDPARLALLLQAALVNGVKAVISFGIAGGLRPGLKPGTTIVARAVEDGAVRAETDPAWMARLTTALPHAVVADLAGVDVAVCNPDGKGALHRATKAAAVDMESHIAARVAALHGIPFAALRVIADPAERTVPSAALVGMRADGSTDVYAVLRRLGRRPRELPGLVRTAFDARAAFAELSRNRRRLSSLFGFHEPAHEGLFGLGVDLDVGFGATSAELPAESS